MKRTRLLLLPILMLTMMLPQTGQATSVHNSMEAPDHNFKHQWLVQVIDKYAPADLAQTMKKDMNTHHRLMGEWRQSSDFKKQKQNCKKKWDKQAKKIQAIQKEQKQGKISAEEAHQKIARLFHHAKFGGRHHAMHHLRAAIQKNDRQAIVKTLEQMDHHIQQANKRLTKKLGKTG
ncbi:hypothetical protein NIE88_13050 [Sporolactobacillus shoreicorticis]|uniref:DUF305 domain-containing protein n=1 Tax=Sporolactobacillus shoreicorticis TaxID=1923877 RepID=A0ABW5S673_9BACL|nr:hypothetical protein [Sporolactobacillus shoreicorticis]MCO7126693.1 hypothetical protein [Sporolactobacillus shoreicorticis]